MGSFTITNCTVPFNRAPCIQSGIDLLGPRLVSDSLFIDHKKSLKSLTTTESDIFFVCDIDLKIDITTLDRIRMNTGDNKVYFPMFFRLVDYTL